MPTDEGERWFSDDELGEMSRPTMDRAIEAIERGDAETAEAALRGDEVRGPVHARHAGRRHRGPDLLRQGQARRRRGRGGLGVLARARLEADGRGDRPRRPPLHRAGARGDLARPLDQRRRPEAGRLRDHRGRGEAHLHDEPVRIRPAARADRPLRRGRLRDDRRRPLLELRPRGLPALLHPLRVHERDAADPLDRLSGLPVPSADRLRAATPASGTGTRTRPTSPTSTSPATASSAPRPRPAAPGRTPAAAGMAELSRAEVAPLLAAAGSRGPSRS